jgi:hypothetical protein
MALAKETFVTGHEPLPAPGLILIAIFNRFQHVSDPSCLREAASEAILVCWCPLQALLILHSTTSVDLPDRRSVLPVAIDTTSLQVSSCVLVWAVSAPQASRALLLYAAACFRPGQGTGMRWVCSAVCFLRD